MDCSKVNYLCWLFQQGEQYLTTLCIVMLARVNHVDMLAGKASLRVGFPQKDWKYESVR